LISDIYIIFWSFRGTAYNICVCWLAGRAASQRDIAGRAAERRNFKPRVAQGLIFGA
jgi:hypothetical protein